LIQLLRPFQTRLPGSRHSGGPPRLLPDGLAARLALGIGLGVCTHVHVAKATDLPVTPPLKAPIAAARDWAGFYLGAHVGFGRGQSDSTLGPAFAHRMFGGLTGGVQAGYNWMLPQGLLFGIEADVSFPNSIGSNSVITDLTGAPAPVTDSLDFMSTVRGRIGYASGPWLSYVTGGFAWSDSRIIRTLPTGEPDKHFYTRSGWAAGAGLEYAVTPNWSARLEYLYSHLGNADVTFGSGDRYTSTADLHTVRIGLNRKIGSATGEFSPATRWVEPESDRWEIHGATTYLAQGYPSFPALYSGLNSLSPSAQLKSTWSNSLYLNARLWDGGEIYYNPELLQGFGLSDTVGVAGFPSGEAQKSNFPYPHYHTSRLFIRQTFGLGGEQETLASDPMQLAGKADISRLTFQVGRFAVTDVFDGNAYAKDARRDFMNWALWAPGAFDYAADKLGLTYGATAELNQKSWALRAGYFLTDSEPNSNEFDMRIFRRGQYVVELETRYSLFSQPGKLRTIGWLNNAYAGSYREALTDAALNLDIAQTRTGRTKYGYVINVEQAVSDDVGLFARWSWNDGKSEIMSFTDIDASLSFGASIKGTRWSRPDDVVGIGGAINALSRDHRDFIAAGGMGVLIGDGALNYRNEQILEAYYLFALNKQLSLTADYQLIVNPAYNADRGPVSVFSGRLRGEF